VIDPKQAESALEAYTSRYNPDDVMIRHKIGHTLRVAENCRRIAESLRMTADDVAFAWLLGLLHDIGRFEQVRRYGTFVDSVSVDHAEFGADLLFGDGLIRAFTAPDFPADQSKLLETAIRQHNKLGLPEDLDGRTRRFCEIIRDADKVDIFRVVSELSFEERAGTSKGLLLDTDEASDEVMQCVLDHRCVPRNLRKTRFDVHISHCCMAFELVFPESRKIAKEQGFLSRLLAVADAEGKPMWSKKGQEQLRIVRREIRTGDIAEKDEDGYLFIAGRKKRYIKMMGHRISLDEIDERIMNAINVRSVSSGTDDHLVIFVLSEDEQKAVRDFVRSQISVLRPAFRVAVIESFPVNEAGKILYGELQKTAERLIDSDK